MKLHFPKQLILIAIFLFVAMASQAQYLWNSDSAYSRSTPNSGRIWGYVFGDFYYKAHSDSLNRGGNNQYTGIPKNRNAFQFRRLYLGYDYNITSKFSAELLLAAEDNFPAFNAPNQTAANGDELSNSKETFFIKYADVQWKDIWKGTTLVVGEQATPAFPFITERIWNYRSIERTISDIRRTPSYDMGAGLRGVFDPGKGNFGYNLLVANGTSDKPASNSFKWFYGDVFAYALNKKLVFDLYADYQRLNWQPGWHHDRQMIKGYIAYNTPALTIGAEGFINTMRKDDIGTFSPGQSTNGQKTDTINTVAEGISLYIHGNIIKNYLRFFARWDGYQPNTKFSSQKNVYSTFAGVSGVNSPSGYNFPGYKMTYSPSTGTPTAATSTGDITAKEMFITAGLDFTPVHNVHFMPNIWYNHYASQLVATGPEKDYDLVYRMTFYFVFGK